MRPSQIESMADVFLDAAKSKATHRRSVLSLRKISSFSNASLQAFGEELLRMVCCVLPVKKGNSDAENVMHFLRRYFEYLENSEAPQGKRPRLTLKLNYKNDA